MKVITIVQPWATLIAVGEKHYETRSWKTKHRGKLAIHAGKKINKEICKQEPFWSVLAEYGYSVENLPSGAIVATCELTGCLQVDTNVGQYAILENTQIVDGNEFEFGWYAAGRYAWALENIQLLEEPIPAKGQQGLWNLPDI